MEPKSLEKKPTQEKLVIRIEVATEKDWEAYRKIRLEAVTGKDAQMFGETTEEVTQQQAMGEEGWKEFLTKDDRFVLLSWKDAEVIGLARGKKVNQEGVWYLAALYVKEDFRKFGVAKRIIATHLREVLRLGGKKVQAGANVVNDNALKLLQSFGFKSYEIMHSKQRDWNEMEVDLTDPAVLQKINEVLNEG